MVSWCDWDWVPRWGVEGTYFLAFRPGGTACAGFVGGFGVGVGHFGDVFWGFLVGYVKMFNDSGVEVDVVWKTWLRAGGGGEVDMGMEDGEIGSFELTFTSHLR